MKKVLITGSTRGIGRQIGLELLDKGLFVYFNGRNTRGAQYIHSSTIKADMSTMHGIQEINKNIKDLDYLVCNVGVSDRTKFESTTAKKWDSTISTNLSIPTFLIQKLKSKIRLNGSILFIGSILGKIPDSSSLSYGVSKGALPMLTKYLAKEFAPKNVTVNTVAPGFISTSWHKDKSKCQMERIQKKILLGRFGTTQEVSNLCISILENKYITGQTIYIDGGYGL